MNSYLRLFQNSYCYENYLHDFDIISVYENGVIEICSRCHIKKFFRDSNRDYLSYHIKQILGPSNPRFKHENASTN